MERPGSTKENMRGTLKKLKKYRNELYFRDINFAFLRSFEQRLRDEGLKENIYG